MVPSPKIRPIGWNGIACLLPEDWNVIVKGNAHLIIEQNLQPLLEFRWHTGSRSSATATHGGRILSRIKEETGKTVELLNPPDFLEGLAGAYEVCAFRLDQQLSPAGAILTCRTCSTPFLFHFFSTSTGSVERLNSFFSTFACCQPEVERRGWAIEDLNFKIPGSFALDTYSFSLGLARLSFKTSAASLKLIRLSSGSQHIRQHSFAQLFANFHGAGLNHATRLDDSTLLLDLSPSLRDILLRTITRKKIYRWAKFAYYPEKDKILGIHLESSRPPGQRADQFHRTELWAYSIRNRKRR